MPISDHSANVMSAVERSRMSEKQIDKALQSLAYGLYVIGSGVNDKATLIVANWVTQVSFHPPLIAMAIEDSSGIREIISSSGSFSVNVLPSGGTDIARAFVRGKTISRNDGVFIPDKGEFPFLKSASSSMGCKVVQELTTGDHIVFVGQVVDAVSHSEGDTLTLRETGWKYKR